MKAEQVFGFRETSAEGKFVLVLVLVLVLDFVPVLCEKTQYEDEDEDESENKNAFIFRKSKMKASRIQPKTVRLAGLILLFAEKWGGWLMVSS